jgi:hypothetical protein
MRRLVAYTSLFVRNEGSVEAKIRILRLITEIRRMVGQGRSYREIMDTLGVPERSFYRYLSQAFEHDMQLMQEHNKDMMALELTIFRDRLTDAYRRLASIASNESLSARDRIGQPRYARRRSHRGGPTTCRPSRGDARPPPPLQHLPAPH